MTKSGLRAAVAAAAVLVFGVFGSSASGSSLFECNDSGRALCIETTDEDNITHSTSTVNRYTLYTIKLSNGGGSTLTNVSFTAELRELVNGAELATDGSFVAAPNGCTSLTSTSFRCTQANLGAGAAGTTFQAFARTPTNTAASDLVLVVRASANERGNDNEGPASNVDTFVSRQHTSLEPRDDFSKSVYFPNGSTQLDTTPGFKGQSSVFRIPVPSTFTGLELGTLEEFSAGDAGYFCPSGFTCFGQSVFVSVPSVFSSTNPANLVSTIALSLLPRGVTERSLRVHHNGTSFTTGCSFGSNGLPTTLPCRTVAINRQAGIVVVNAYDADQGNWGFS